MIQDPTSFALAGVVRAMGIGYDMPPFVYRFQRNECSNYHAAIYFDGERCPCCKAQAECERLEGKIDKLNDRLTTALDERDGYREQLIDLRGKWL